MSAIQMRGDIEKYLDDIDENFLKIIHVMLATYVKQKEEDAIIGYDIKGNPLKALEAKKKFAQRLNDMDNGDYISMEDLKKEAQTW